MSSRVSSISIVNVCKELPVLLASNAMDEFPLTGMTATAYSGDRDAPITSSTRKGIEVVVSISPMSSDTVMLTSNGVSARVFWGAVTLSVVVKLSPPTEGHASTIELRLVMEVGVMDVIHPSGPSTLSERFDSWLPVLETMIGVDVIISGVTVVGGGISTSARVSSGMLSVMLILDSGASIPPDEPNKVRLATTSMTSEPASGSISEGPRIVATSGSESPIAIVV
ncbi:MAG: Uncharacterised protein [Marine Group II euryarchaeote MED-G33]|nr:MAG: Uncharacterised protein [Marine Group II euryarchaeote MED-G33]